MGIVQSWIRPAGREQSLRACPPKPGPLLESWWGGNSYPASVVKLGPAFAYRVQPGIPHALRGFCDWVTVGEATKAEA